MLIAVCSMKGSPGVTTWALALAACWPRPASAVLVECDPSGGSLAARFGLAPSAGLGSLAAAARRDTAAGLLWSHTQALPGGLAAVVAPSGADYTRAALHTLLDSRRPTVSVLRGVAARGTVVVADCGRLDSTSPAMPIAREADQLLLLVRPLADQLTNLAADLSMVDLWSMRPGLVLVGDGYPANEITRELGVPVVAAIPHDTKGARALCGQSGARRGPARSPLAKAARQLATRMNTPAEAALPAAGHERSVEHFGSTAGLWQALGSPPDSTSDVNGNRGMA
jgi:hypothetical protein